MAPSTTDYTIGWICVLPAELVAAKAMLDEVHESPTVDPDDSNVYICGRIGKHDTVIACLPAGHSGMTSAAKVVTMMLNRFEFIRFVLLVGVGSGVPSRTNDIRLGDVVISYPSGANPAVVRYDFMKKIRLGSARLDYLDSPSDIALSAVTEYRSVCQLKGNPLFDQFAQTLRRFPSLRSNLNPWESALDVLFQPSYQHQEGLLDCSQCNPACAITRPRRRLPLVFFGTIASGNRIVEDGVVRDTLNEDLGGILAIEMEAAGIMNAAPCLVIKGISDYADSHRNGHWQPYAAFLAALTAKEILSYLPQVENRHTRVVRGVTALHTAANQGDLEIIKELLDHGYDPNAGDSEGLTPLHYVARKGRLDCVEWLVTRGNADVSMLSSGNKFPKDLARANNNHDVVEFLDNPPVVTVPRDRVRQAIKTLQAAPQCEDRCREVCMLFNSRVQFHHTPHKDDGLLGDTLRLLENRSIYDLLYNQEHNIWADITRKWRDATSIDSIDGIDDSRVRWLRPIQCKWIHLPANNILWVKDFVKRICYSDGKTEEDCKSILGFIENSLLAHTESTLHACFRDPSFHEDSKREKVSIVIPYIDMESDQFLNKDNEDVNRNILKRWIPSSLSTRNRDHDQVVYRYTRDKCIQKTHEGIHSDANILMVNQLWLWRISEDMIITTMPERWHEGPEPQLLNVISRFRSHHYPVQDTMYLISNLIYQCITFSEDPNKAGLDERYMNIFARAIATASNTEVACYSAFSNAIRDNLLTEIRVEKEIKLLQEIKDIRDELNMLRRVLSDQKTIVEKVMKWAMTQYEFDWGVESRILQVERMDEDADRVEKSLNHLLDLKQKQSNIEEARSARAQAENTALQGKYIFVFTIVTVVFTPLSFMATLFAIQIHDFPHDDKGLDFSGRWIGTRMAAGELITLGIVALATAIVVYRGKLGGVMPFSKTPRILENNRLHGKSDGGGGNDSNLGPKGRDNGGTPSAKQRADELTTQYQELLGTTDTDIIAPAPQANSKQVPATTAQLAGMWQRWKVHSGILFGRKKADKENTRVEESNV